MAMTFPMFHETAEIASINTSKIKSELTTLTTLIKQQSLQYGIQ